MNYFELFDLPPAPSVNRSMLAVKYFELQKKNHPDFFTQATEFEKEDALKCSADINKAYTIFKDDQRSIEYFLQMTGHIAEDEKYDLPAEFLMEMMELNEAFSDTNEGGVRKQVEDYEASLYNDIKPVINDYNPATTMQADLLKLKEYYYKKKYLNRILERLAD